MKIDVVPGGMFALVSIRYSDIWEEWIASKTQNNLESFSRTCDCGSLLRGWQKWSDECWLPPVTTKQLKNWASLKKKWSFVSLLLQCVTVSNQCCCVCWAVCLSNEGGKISQCEAGDEIRLRTVFFPSQSQPFQSGSSRCQSHLVEQGRMETASNSSQKKNTVKEGVREKRKAYRKDLCSLGCSLHFFLPTQPSFQVTKFLLGSAAQTSSPHPPTLFN